ncbi:uncharacterized protein LOC134786459 [Penaeus indicus]|uniref:uncharacterized protein LOC134786459 n=1 Tax=Penaeus indicus TaxID=29960 RepID=UPI00300D6B55
MERGFGYARERPAGAWHDFPPRDRDESLYYYRDAQSHYPWHAQQAQYYAPEERVRGRRYDSPFEETKAARGHREEHDLQKEFGFSYTSGIREMQDIKSRQNYQQIRNHERRKAAFDYQRERRSHERVPHYVNGFQESVQHPRREFFHEWNRGRRERSPSPRRNGAWRGREDFDAAVQPRPHHGRSSPPHYRQREPARRADSNPSFEHRSRQMPFRSYSPTGQEEQRRRNLGRQAFRPRSNSLESYWGPAISPTNSNEAFTDAYYESSTSSPTQQPPPVFQHQPRERAGQRPQPHQPFIPQPDYTWHKKKKRFPVQHPDYPF